MTERFLLPKLMPRERRIMQIGSFCGQLPMAKAWWVEITEARGERSDAQNRYLNGVAYKLIGDAIGYERDETSEFLCGTYFGWKDKRVPKKPSNPSGIESVPIRTTTTDEAGRRRVLTKQEFSDYVAFVQRFAASKGIHVPDPGEATHLEEVA
jgi:hypothetical protein